MSTAIQNQQRTTTPQAVMPPAQEWAYKTAMSSSRQQAFQSVLDQQGGAWDPENRSSGVNSLTDQIKELEQAQSPPSREALANQVAENPLATSALLRLTALTSGGNMSSYGLKAFSGASASKASGTKTTAPAAGYNGPVNQAAPNNADPVGTLSAKFESGEDGTGAIGYDDQGGTSYGMYQIASRPGTMNRFLDYLDDKAPALASRLRDAGPANTGGRNGRMPSEWKKIAGENPNGFAKLQRDFIAETHYTPAAEEIQERTGVDMNKQSAALREVLWSTAVQHGPRGAANIFSKVLNRTPSDTQTASAENIIDSIYASRAGQFGNSSRQIRSSVGNRFREERDMAVAMLDSGNSSTSMRA